MAVVFPPNSPPINRAPVRTPLPLINNNVVIKDVKGWTVFFELVYAAILYLLTGPVLLSGLDADLPDATLYPENSRWFSTDITTEYINLYATPGDPTTAAWTAM